METKSIEQIKEEVARENNCSSYNQFLDKLVWSSEFELMEKWNDEVAIRYAKQFQAPIKDLEDWKESSLRVMDELNLQAIGDELGLKLGSSIAPQVLPEIMGLKERVQELEDGLYKLYNSDGWLASEDHKKIQSINLSNHEYSKTNPNRGIK